MDFETAAALCRTFPGCTEDIKWGACRVFSVGLKMFAVTDSDTPATRFSFKVDDDRFLELTDRSDIIPAPYMARLKWVSVEKPTALSDEEAAQLLRQAYDLIFAKLSKKLQREISAAQGTEQGEHA